MSLLRRRWDIETAEGLPDSNYWAFSFVVHECRTPWNHFHLFLQKHTSDGANFYLVTGADSISTSDRIFYEHDAVLDRPEWETILDSGDIAKLRAEDAEDHWQVDYTHVRELVVTHACQNGSEMNHRVCEEMNDYPMLLMWICYRKPTIACPDRLRVCESLVELRLK